MQQRCCIMIIAFCLVLFASAGITSSNSDHVLRGLEPGSYLVEKAGVNRLLLIGTHHKNIHIHHLIIQSLPALVADAGINTLFVEIPTSQQEAIERFMSNDAGVETIEVCEIIASPSYREILLKARSLGMNIIAMDSPGPFDITRDEWMARHVTAYLEDHPQAKGLIIAGQRHVLKGIKWNYVTEPSLADHLEAYAAFSVITWPDAHDEVLPFALDINPSQFAGIKDPTLMAMNTREQVSLATSADGVIFMPRSR